MLVRELSFKGPKGPGVAYLRVCNIPWEKGFPALFGRDPVGFSGRPSRGVSMWQWEVPWPDHLLENPFFKYEPCTVLVVLPAIYLWWRPTVWMVAIVGIVRNVYAG